MIASLYKIRSLILHKEKEEGEEDKEDDFIVSLTGISSNSVAQSEKYKEGNRRRVLSLDREKGIGEGG